MPIVLQTLATLAVSAVGAIIVSYIGIPGGMLMGGAIAVAIASLAGMPVQLPMKLRNVLFVCVGLSMGANVSADTLHLIPQWPITLALLAIELVVIVALCGLVLRKIFRLDSGTAYLSSFPGHLSFIMALASAGTGNPRQIVIMQTERVMVLTLFAPIGALFLPVGHFSAGATEPVTLINLAMVAAGCAFSGWVFTRLKLPAGFVLGSMAFATAMKLSGNFSGALPPILVQATFVGMAALIGSRFAGISRSEMAHAALGGTATTLITIVVTTAFAVIASLFVTMPIGQIWLGLAPGGLESMGALGIALGYDTAFIAGHHVSRLLMLSLAIPMVVALVKRRQPLTEPSDNPETR